MNHAKKKEMLRIYQNSPIDACIGEPATNQIFILRQIGA